MTRRFRNRVSSSRLYDPAGLSGSNGLFLLDSRFHRC